MTENTDKTPRHGQAPQPSFYRRGGYVPVMGPKSQSYVRRKADSEIFEALKSGEFCSVFAPRQVGKSSLVLGCAAYLRDVGYETVVIDMSAISADDTNTFYKNIFDTLVRSFSYTRR